MQIEMNRISKFALWGAAGFGSGGAIGGTAIVLIEYTGPLLMMKLWLLGLGVFLQGAFGGLALGLVKRLNWKRITRIVVSTGIGFLAVLWAGFGVYFVMSMGYSLATFGIVLWGVIAGAIGGLGLGLAIWGCDRILVLSFIGALTCGWQQVYFAYRDWFQYLGSWESIIIWAVFGVIGGVFLGATLGFLKRSKAE